MGRPLRPDGGTECDAEYGEEPVIGASRLSQESDQETSSLAPLGLDSSSVTTTSDGTSGTDWMEMCGKMAQASHAERMAGGEQRQRPQWPEQRQRPAKCRATFGAHANNNNKWGTNNNGHGLACRSVSTSPPMVTTSCLSSTGGWPIQPVRVYVGF